jgi:glycosyltransferase involved in cell wall biosynthesis
VTYEALACGLPSIVTPSSGSVARDGVEGLVIPPGEVEPLAHAIETLGRDPALREDMARAARRRSLDFTWTRYHEAVARAIDDCRS